MFGSQLWNTDAVVSLWWIHTSLIRFELFSVETTITSKWVDRYRWFLTICRHEDEEEIRWWGWWWGEEKESVDVVNVWTGERERRASSPGDDCKEERRKTSILTHVTNKHLLTDPSAHFLTCGDRATSFPEATFSSFLSLPSLPLLSLLLLPFFLFFLSKI